MLHDIETAPRVHSRKWQDPDRLNAEIVRFKREVYERVMEAFGGYLGRGAVMSVWVRLIGIGPISDVSDG